MAVPIDFLSNKTNKRKIKKHKFNIFKHGVDGSSGLLLSGDRVIEKIRGFTQ